jgi:hypothetical protein
VTEPAPEVLALFVDDERAAPQGWTLVTTCDDALSFLQDLKAQGGTLDMLSLDHDLGWDLVSGDDLTTRPLVLWMCENEWWPKKVWIHTGNPSAEKWLVGMVKRYAPTNTLAGYGSNYWGTDNTTVCRDKWPE